MVSPTSDVFPNTPRPAPLAWKEFRRRSGLSTQHKVYVYDASPQIVPQSPTALPTLSLSPIIGSTPLVGMESPRKEHSGHFLQHVSQALQALGASTGGNIADYIANNFQNEFGIPYEKGRKLHYMVNAILSSPKYKYLFLKDQVLKDEKRSLWRLKKPEETVDEDTTVPNEMSLSSLIPSSPFLSLKVSRDDVDVPNTNTSKLNNSSNIVPIATTSSTETYGGSDGGHDGEKEAISRTTEHPGLSSSTSSPSSPDPSSPNGDVPSLSLSSRRRKRKGLDSSLGIDIGSPKQMDEQVDEKKRRLDVAA